MTYKEAIEFIMHFIQYDGCIWGDKFTDTPYGIKDKYRELDGLLQTIRFNSMNFSPTL